MNGRVKGESISKQLVSSSKTGWREQACYQSESIKFIHPLFSLQNGRFASVEGSSERERFYVQGGPERCLLLRSCAQESSKISSISMEVKYLQVPVSMFRSGSSTRIFTKLLKIPIAVLRRIQIRIIIYLDDMLLMSQTINGLEIARDFFIAKSRLCNKSAEICSGALAKDRVSMSGNRLSENHITTGKSKKNETEMPKLISNPRTTIWEVTNLLVSLC